MIAGNPIVPALEPRPEFSGLLKEDHRFARGTGQGVSESVNGAFDRLMLQSGLRTTPGVWLGLCVLCGLACGGFLWLLTEREFVSAFAAFAGLVAPIGLAILLRSRRQRKIMQQLPGMAEELARGARTGRNLESAFRLVAADTASPLGDELRLAVRRTEMGLDVASAVRDLPQRTGVDSLTMFTSAISVNQDTGGDLTLVLDRLAAAIRDRLHFIGRLRAATIAARMGAVMMVVVPILVISFYVFRDPEYLPSLLSDFWGRMSIWVAVILQFIGCLIVWRILSRSARF